MLLYQPKAHRPTAAETKNEIRILNQYSLKDLKVRKNLLIAIVLILLEFAVSNEETTHAVL